MKTLIITISILACIWSANGQAKKSVVIGSMLTRPNAILVINPPNSDQGFLLPQLTTAQRISIGPTSPNDDGLMVFDITDKSFYYWNNNAWVKGLGSQVTPALTYDPATQKLSIAGGNIVDLNTLKEVPSQAGNSGKYLTTDGTTLSWATLSSIGDITGIITGPASGLTGGSTSGDITLSANTDGTTISINGSNQLQLSNGAVSNSKLAGNAVDSSNIVDGTVTGSDILDNSISTNDLVNGSVTTAKIGAGQVTTSNIASGGNDKILTTDPTGVVSWSDLSSLANDDQGLSLTTNTLNIDNGTSANLNVLTLGGDVAGALNATLIQPNAINSTKIQDGTVGTIDIASGGNDQVLTTNGSGTVTWVNRVTFVDDDQNLSLSSNTLNIVNGTSVDLNALSTSGDVSGTLNSQVIQPGAVNSGKILDGSIASVDITDGTIAATDIASTGNDKVLTTNAGGSVTWADRSTFTDDNQTLAFAGNTLTIQDGNAINLSAAGQVTGLLDNLAVAPGTANQVMVTNGTGTTSQWVTPGGDVTGPVAASTVARLQGRNVSNTAPAVGDVLTWDGTAWVPTVVPGVTPVTEFLAIDPSNFVGLQEDGDDKYTLGLMESNDGTFVFAAGNAREIMAPVNLPHGATIQSLTVYYEYSLLLGTFQVILASKNFSGGAPTPISTINTPLIGIGVVTSTNPVVAVVDNSLNSYRVIVKFTNLTDADQPSEALQRIYGVRIQYTR